MPRSAFRSILETIGILAGAIVVAWVLQAYLVKPFQIPSASMVPTMNIGDRILVNRLVYRFGEVKRGDVIVFKAPIDPDVDYVKRVIAVARDRVEVTPQGAVVINGELQVENYTNPNSTRLQPFTEQTVPEGNVFVMGDNRGDSKDSRFWTSPWLPVDDIIGKTFFTYWPPGRMGMLN
ncbi:MAG: signal peptidase I [Actinomycetota bacterium]